MKIKNREMANKFKDAFKKAGIDLPAKKDKPVKSKTTKACNSSRSVKATSPQVAASRNANSAGDDKGTSKNTQIS